MAEIRQDIPEDIREEVQTISSTSAGERGRSGLHGSKQEQLEDWCRQNRIRPPVYSIVSDRRGGRTAWSAVCELNGQSVNARYWYDGQYVNNAKEDAAEVALIKVGAQAPEKH